MDIKGKKLAENMDFDKYNDLPIDNFGEEMLSRMGWKGEATSKQVVIQPRNFRLGLGAVPLNENLNIPKYSDNLENSFKKKNLYGTKVKIVEGKHKGLNGIIVDKNIESNEDIILYLNKFKFIEIELKLNKQIIKIEPNNIKLRNNKKKSSKKSKDHKNYQKRSDENKSKLVWVQENIIVRIIKKNNKYYNLKAVVADVLDSYTFSLITLEDKVNHIEFNESDIETVIPKINENIKILVGDKKGEIGKILEKDKQDCTAIVNIFSIGESKKYQFDEICSLIE